ncbi:MAG: hypothetical protein A3F84_19205 [Candidatus Handelsmanbacteria bacterium RIFCSPLOWO2_12_FULL_64_10]|uniref:DUF362 domain-containing protein n=1 Tax=Handelsmanbacteria sp. (strain RIFCSPLOWO2_12_FULL_64_10) TaxID=1817868 RepID=A0A1F6D6R1_HANXR|nr:MAG: hypothetical protein A3F84_19205 [Candidatus Handelsmanbacteria bacterium RIFCSPLOWO2_12_FULL_64_10]
MAEKQYKVRAARCDHRATEEEVYRTLRRITDPLTRSWEKIEKAKRVVIKFNMMKPQKDIAYFGGRRQELVDDAVCRSVLRLLKEHTTANLVATDTNGYTPNRLAAGNVNYEHHLKAFGVEFVDSNLPPFKTYKVPGGGFMFDQYTLSACFADADAAVSVAKMKNHLFMGVTLCMKNLFGLTPMLPPEGRVRTYFHHAIRLSYVLPDLGKITNPCLNIVDALTGQWGREWGGQGRVGDALIAGDQITATDACAAHLMGHDPSSDWPTPPFRRDRNHLLVAAQGGFGTVDLKEIDFESEVTSPLAEFDSEEQDPPQVMATVRQTACEQGLLYRDRMKEMVDRYRGNFIYMQDGDVVWNGPDPSHLRSHREFSGKRPGSALWLKLVDPEEREGERFRTYEECLAGLAA